MEQGIRIRPVIPVLAMVLLFVAVVVFSLIHAAQEANRAGAARAKAAVSMAVNSEIQTLTVMAGDNGIWDDASQAVYGGMIDVEFLWSAWGVATAERKIYDAMAIIDEKGETKMTFRSGRASRVSARSQLGASLDILSARVRSRNEPQGGIVKTPDGIVLVGVSEILPTSPALAGSVPAGRIHFIVFTKALDQDMVTRLGRDAMVTGLKFGSQARGEESVELMDPAGGVSATFSWNKSVIGYDALKRAVPIILFAILIHIFFALIFVLHYYASVKQLERDARFDSLSRLPNRRALCAELAYRLAHGERVALAMIDLDGFKAINDNFGHGVGDRLIKATASLLAELVGDRGTVARLGGDEFAILLYGNHCVTRLETMAQDILARLSQPFRIDERTVVVGASIGLVSASLHDYDTSEFLRRADVAMYAAKRAGKMRMYWYDEMLEQRRAKAQTIEIELRAAIENESFDMVYQPIVAASDKSVVGVEALLRWNSPTRGDIGPAEFIPVAEETGLIDRIGLIALRRVCTDGMMWPDVNVSINVSSSQLRNPDFVGNLAKVLNETGFPANRLMLEITETYLLYDPETALGVVRALKIMGVGIALDDYGTGYASINFLERFMLDKLKIDGQMIVDAYRTESGLILLNAVITMSRALGISICAEGIETEAQAELMRVAGCEQLQGWHYARPMPADEVTRQAAQRREAA